MGKIVELAVLDAKNPFYLKNRRSLACDIDAETGFLTPRAFRTDRGRV